MPRSGARAIYDVGDLGFPVIRRETPARRLAVPDSILCSAMKIGIRAYITCDLASENPMILDLLQNGPRTRALSNP
jgi:hypothetical protein